jgi:hypothetical protein
MGVKTGGHWGHWLGAGRLLPFIQTALAPSCYVVFALRLLRALYAVLLIDLARYQPHRPGLTLHINVTIASADLWGHTKKVRKSE